MITTESKTTERSRSQQGAMMTTFTKLLFLTFLVSLLSACAKKPILYDNTKMKSNPAKADSAIDACMKRAEEAGAEGDGKLADAAYRGVSGGTASAAAGGAAAAAGGGRYNVGRSAGMSAAGGFAGNVVLGMFDRDVDPIFARYVENCLADKGYRTIGWK